MPDSHAANVLRLADAMLRYALLPGAIAAVLGITISAVLAGLPGALGALVGAAVAFASSLLTLLLMRKTAGSNPYVVMAVSLGGFVGKLLVLFLVLMALRGVEALHPTALALTMLGTILVWVGAEVRAFQKTKIPTIIPASDGR
ncbi:MAG: hypothetical protein GEU98_06070 [Pseudonocardiaceae bacterium]|nr:hypothetical protein [Pseudonocardiaceae bacterium]